MNLKEKSKIYFQKHWVRITGVAVGLLGGYLYYHYIGCASGTCPITSNPYRMMLYGAVMGYLLFDIFSKDGRLSKNGEHATNQNDNHTQQ